MGLAQLGLKTVSSGRYENNTKKENWSKRKSQNSAQNPTFRAFFEVLPQFAILKGLRPEQHHSLRLYFTLFL